jgi:hypothetical protein
MTRDPIVFGRLVVAGLFWLAVLILALRVAFKDDRVPPNTFDDPPI